MRNTREQPGSSSVPMRPADAFFWYAEMATPTLRPLVAGLFLLDRPPDRRRFRAAMTGLARAMPRLRQRVADAPFGLGLPFWRDVGDDFDLDYHLREVVLPPPATHDQLLHFAGELFSAPLDHLRPLWEAHLISGIAGGRAALFFKLHHAVLDGVGSNALFDMMTRPQRADRPATHPGSPIHHNGHQSPIAQAAQRGGLIATAGWQLAQHAAAHPVDTLRQTADLTRSASGLLRDLIGSMTGSVPETHAVSVGRRLDGRVLSLARMRRLKRALGVTLNDLVLTTVSGAVRHYRAHHRLPTAPVSCMVPMSLRRDHERGEPGNRVGGFIVDLPTDEPDPFIRLDRIRRQTQRAKQNGHGAAYGALMQAAALIPAAVFRAVAHGIEGRVQLICSNVPGPPKLRYLAGAKIDAVYPFAPMMFGIPLAIALASYGPTYGIGISTDPAAFPDPERLGKALLAEVDAIERLISKRHRATPAITRRSTGARGAVDHGAAQRRTSP